MKKIQSQGNKSAKKAWITKGIENACKKKNTCMHTYAKFVKKKTGLLSRKNNIKNIKINW